ncbi:glycosyltransferase family 2 protein [Leuconostoc mesenteroides]|uniref:glycosyltransferase family 2 protein n=1 Tax=Leuconostoc mesenteroides TaxID=1245 RepID=UPI0032DF44C1
MSVLLSIIIPAYNAQDYLSNALSSIDSIDDSVEIVIINDGSTDNTLKIALEWKIKYPQITIVNQLNVGLAQTRNTAIRIAKGAYLMFLDPDDKYENKAISSVITCIEKEKPDLIIYDVQDYDVVKKKVVKITHHGKLPKNAGAVYWNKVYKKELFDGLEAPKGHLFEDTAIIPAVVAQARKVILVNEVHYTYNVGRNDSIMSKNWGKNFEDKIFALEYLNKLSNKLKYSEQIKVQDYLIANVVFTLRFQKNLNLMTFSQIMALCDLGKTSIELLKIKNVGLVKYMIYWSIITSGRYYAKFIK